MLNHTVPINTCLIYQVYGLRSRLKWHLLRQRWTTKWYDTDRRLLFGYQTGALPPAPTHHVDLLWLKPKDAKYQQSAEPLLILFGLYLATRPQPRSVMGDIARWPIRIINEINVLTPLVRPIIYIIFLNKFWFYCFLARTNDTTRCKEMPPIPLWFV